MRCRSLAGVATATSLRGLLRESSRLHCCTGDCEISGTDYRLVLQINDIGVFSHFSTWLANPLYRRNSRLSLMYKSLHGLAGISTSPFRRSSKPTRSADGDIFVSCLLKRILQVLLLSS